MILWIRIGERSSFQGVGKFKVSEQGPQVGQSELFWVQRHSGESAED